MTNALGLGAAKGSDADRAYFARFPNRSCRVRRAFPGEAEGLVIGHVLPALPPSHAWFIVSVQIKPGVRTRWCLSGPRERDTDAMTNDECAAVFQSSFSHMLARQEVDR